MRGARTPAMASVRPVIDRRFILPLNPTAIDGKYLLGVGAHVLYITREQRLHYQTLHGPDEHSGGGRRVYIPGYLSPRFAFLDNCDQTLAVAGEKRLRHALGRR